MLSLRDAAIATGLPLHTLKRLVRTGKLPVVRVNQRIIRVRQSDLDAMIQAL